MNAWILIITLVAPGTSSIESIEFPTEDHCQEAKERYSKATDLSGFYIRSVCVSRG